MHTKRWETEADRQTEKYKDKDHSGVQLKSHSAICLYIQISQGMSSRHMTGRQRDNIPLASLYILSFIRTQNNEGRSTRGSPSFSSVRPGVFRNESTPVVAENHVIPVLPRHWLTIPTSRPGALWLDDAPNLRDTESGVQRYPVIAF